jgi:steroid 5-alpha reductase family enzyme
MNGTALGTAALWGLTAALALGTATWAVSVAKRDVSVVDSVWGPLIWIAAAAGLAALPAAGPRAGWLLAGVALWAIRLAAHITWRNWGAPEDRRYQDIRARNEPRFWLKSLYLVFGLQGVLACIVAAPVVVAGGSNRPLGWLDAAGLALLASGLLFEAVADAQLARFKGDPANRGKVMDRGLWRYSRHPNYFGECCVWWGVYLVALAAGGWWTLFSPLLMTFLLLKVSGVTLLEKDLERRPAYRDYIARTSAFLPWPPRA